MTILLNLETPALFYCQNLEMLEKVTNLENRGCLTNTQIWKIEVAWPILRQPWGVWGATPGGGQPPQSMAPLMVPNGGRVVGHASELVKSLRGLTKQWPLAFQNSVKWS